MTEDIAAPLEREGNVTQDVIQPAISGAEITRLSMYKANALRELAAGQEALGRGVASGVDALFKGINAGTSDDMAREGALAGRSSVTRDSNGDIQVQPTSGELFGLGGRQYSRAVSDGTQQQITTNLQSDLKGLAAQNVGNPDAFKSAAAGYLQGHTGGLGSGVEGKTALLDAQDYAQQLYDNQLHGKASTDVGSAKKALLDTVTNTQEDLVALANGGMAGSDEFNKTLGRQSDAYNSLTGNPAFGYSKDMADEDRVAKVHNVTDATIHGSMATAFQHGGLNAAAAVIPTIDDHPGASEADKALFKVSATAYLKTLQAANSTAATANKTAFEETVKAGAADPKNLPPITTLQDYEQRALVNGDPDTAQAARNQITNFRYNAGVSTLSPSEHDAINGIGQPHPTAVAPVSGQDSMAPFRNAIASIESRGSGGYAAIGPVTKSGDRAYGAYQVMGANIPSWTKAALGYSMTPEQFRASPAAQDAVFNHQFGQYIQKYGPAGAASVWFTGRPGGGSVSDITGTTADKYVSMFNARLGNAQPPEGGGAPAAGQPAPRPISWQDIHDNPGLAPMYAQIIAKDGETRTKTGETIIEAATKGLQNQVPPSQETMVQIEQLAADNPKLANKYEKYATELGGYQLNERASAPGGGGQFTIDQARAQAMATPDILGRQVVDNAQARRDASEKLLKENPVAAGINMKAISRPPPPLDPTQPQTIAAHFAGNAQVVDAISPREQGFSKSVVFPNETGRFGAAMSGPAQVGNAILQSIGALPQDKRDATLETPGVKEAILGMANSPDALKKQVAFSFMNQVYDDDPQSFDGKFGKDGLRRLRDWQDVEQHKTPDQIAKDANTANDPSTIRAQEVLAKEAEKTLKGVTPADIANKLAPHWFQSIGFGDYTPISGVPAQTKAALLDDYSRAYTEQFSVNSDATAADKYAVERTGLKWGPSDANGGRVMAYPPERSPAYPQVNGSHDYIGSQLADFVAQAGHAGAEAHLVPNSKTQGEADNGKPRGYSVVVQGTDGQYALIPGRFYADPAAAQAAANAAFPAQQLRSGHNWPVAAGVL